MTFATEILKNDSERFFLVNFKARRYLGAGVNTTGNFYTYNVGLGYDHITQVYVTDAACDSFSYNATTGVLTVEDSHDLENTANIVIMEYDYFLTTGKAVTTIGVGSFPDVTWEPLILKAPTFSQSVRSILDGVFALSSSNVQIISLNGFHRKLFAKDTSVSNAPINIWMCISSAENSKLVFTGDITSGQYSEGVVTLSIIDSYNKLLKPATCGDLSVSRYAYGTSGRAYISPQFEQKAVPITIGYSTPYTLKSGWRHLDAYGSPTGATYHITGGLTAVKYSPQNPSLTDTVLFDIGRIVSSDVLRLNFGTVSAAYNLYVSRKIPVDSQIRTSGNETIDIWEKIVYLQCSSHNCEIGDYIPPLGGWVCQIKNVGFGSYNLAVACPVYGLSQTNIDTPPANGSTSVPSLTNNSYPAISVWMENGESVLNEHTYIPLALVPNQRTVSHSTRYLPFSLNSIDTYTDGGVTIGRVTVSINPTTAKLIDTDASQSGINPLINATVKYRMRAATTQSHAAGLKYLLKSAGMTVNDASFTQADVDLTNTELSMTLPLQPNGDFPKYIEACQAVTGSTLGLLAVNSDREIEYKVLNHLSTADHVRDQSDILRGDTSTKIDYQDMATTVSFKHPQIEPNQGDSGVYTAEYETNNLRKYLHRVDKSKVINHYIKNITNIAQKIYDYVNNETIEYNIATATKDLNTAIGDVVEITTDASLSNTGSSLGVVVSSDSSINKTTLKLNELRGL